MQAVLAIEDRRFYEHPGDRSDPHGRRGHHQHAGDKPYLVGGSTHHPAAGANFFLTPEEVGRTRKLQEQFLAVVLETAATKDEILELYLNDVYLGQRGSFAHPRRRRSGAAVLRQGRQQPLARRGGDDRRRHPVAVHPLAVQQSPTRARDRRNVVLQAMADAGYITPGRGRARAAGNRSPSCSARSTPRRRTSSTTSARRSTDQYPGPDAAAPQPVDVYTTLDLNLQRIAQDAVRDGLDQVDDHAARASASRARPRRR